MEDYSEADFTSDVHGGDMMDNSTDNPVAAESGELRGSSERGASNPRPRKTSKKLAGLTDEEADMKRQRANGQERIRQRAITEAFNTLAAHLPDMPTFTHKKGCKQSILNNCIDYIQGLRNLIRGHDTWYRANFGREFVSYRMTGTSHEQPSHHPGEASQIMCGQHNMHQPAAINQGMGMQQPAAPSPVIGIDHMYVPHAAHRNMEQIVNQQSTVVPNSFYPPLKPGLSQQIHMQPFTPSRSQCRSQMNHDQSQTHYPASTFLPALSSSIDLPGHMDSQPIVPPSLLRSTSAERPRTRMFDSTPTTKTPGAVDNRPSTENVRSTPVSHQSSQKNQLLDSQKTPLSHSNNSPGSSTPNRSIVSVTSQRDLSSGSGEPVGLSNPEDESLDYRSDCDSFLNDIIKDSVNFEKENFLSTSVSPQSSPKKQLQNSPLLSPGSGDFVGRINSLNNTSGYSNSFLDEFIEALDDLENGKDLG